MDLKIALSFLVENIEVISIIISIITTVVLIVTVREMKISRRLQYLPYLRYDIPDKSFVIEDRIKATKNNVMTKVPLKTEHITDDMIDSMHKNSEKLIIKNDGLGIAKEVRIIVDYSDVIKSLRKIDDTREIFHLKPIEEMYEIISFKYKFRLGFTQYFGFWKKAKNKSFEFINKVIRIFDKNPMQRIRLQGTGDIIYNRYYFSIIKPDEEIVVDLQPVIGFMSLFELFCCELNRNILTLPLHVSYYDLEGKRHYFAADIRVINNYSRYSIDFSAEEYKSFMERSKTIDDFQKNLKHSFSNRFQFSSQNRFKRRYNILVQRIRKLFIL